MKKNKFTSLLSLFLCALLLCGCGSAKKSDSYAYSSSTSAYEAKEEEWGAPIPMPAEAPMAEADYVAGNGIGNSNSAAKVDNANKQGQMQTQKIIYSANAQIETTEYEKTIEAVAAMVEHFGGFIESSSISGANYYRSSRGLRNLRTANYTLRIPSEYFQEMTGSLSELGNVPYCNTYSENVTASYYDVQSRKTAYETQEKRLLEMLAIAETVEDMLAIQEQLTEVQYQIDSLQSRLTNYDRQVSYSTVNLTVSEVEEYTETPIVKLTYGQKLSQSFKQSLENVGDFFTDTSLWLMGNLPEIILWCAILFAAWKLLKKLLSKREKREKKERISWKQRRAEKKASKTASVPISYADKNDEKQTDR